MGIICACIYSCRIRRWLYFLILICQGAAGAQGVRGAKGARGLAGEVGATGVEGEAGAQV